MSIILGLDLGTNSIAWAIRDLDMPSSPEQIIQKGVVIFQKGVGEEKGMEFSLSAERTRLRAARRKNQRRRWRKIDLLRILISERLCPLTTETLEQWSQPSRKSERKYPTDPLFINWLRLDFDNDGVPDFANPFDLRAMATERQLSPFEFGRICYHLTQRRGYLSNRNDKMQDDQADEEIQGEDAKPKRSEQLGKVATAIRELENRLDGHTVGQELAEAIRNGERARRRKDESTNISRLTLQKEFMQIADHQGISPRLTEKIRKVIFDQRPLRSQKGLVGKCIYEKDRSRCAISHPEFELFRMWQVLNNIKYSIDGKKTWQFLNDDMRKDAQQKFFRRSKPVFTFEDIAKSIRRKLPVAVFNFKDTQGLSGCPTMAGLMAVLGDEKVWRLREAALKKLQWEQTEKRSSRIKYAVDSPDLYDYWQWLFQMDNDRDQEIVCRNVQFRLGLSPQDANRFVQIPIKQGYASLSLKALHKINRWLVQGVRYDRAVFWANLPHIAGVERWRLQESAIKQAVDGAVAKSELQKKTVEIANVLISRYNNLPANQRFGRRDSDYDLDAGDRRDIELAASEYVGQGLWFSWSTEEKKNVCDQVGSLYAAALRQSSNAELRYVKLPRLDQTIRLAVAEVLGIDPSDRILDKIYHPSQMEAFLPAIQETGVSGMKQLNTPRTDSLRNPMAMRSLYELRKLINLLIRKGLIDEHTRIIVEMARELNDANKRKAIEQYQRERRKENEEYLAGIERIFRAEGKALPADPSSYIDRYRLREEQPSRVCMYTGRTINDADLFDEFTTDVEHTVARSLSFDDSLQNKTIAFNYYNREIKTNLLPVQLPNYSEDTQGYTAIEPRLRFWEEKIEVFQNRIDRASWRSRMATTKGAKDKAIQERHYCLEHLRYWQAKLKGFKITEVTEGFKNSQLVDTQIITKYGLLYLRTLFLYVRATKGVITDRVKRIWGIQNNTTAKDRSSHTHHLEDAIIQTLLYKERNKPDIYNQLAEGYRDAEMHHWKEPRLPNPWLMEPEAFFAGMRKLTDGVLIYHADRDQTMKQTKRRLEVGGANVYARGRGIRRSLHKDTFYGAIKVLSRQDPDTAGSDKDDAASGREGGPDFKIKYRTGFVFRGSSLDQIRKSIPNIVDPRLRKLAAEKGAEAILKEGFFEIPPSGERLRRDPGAKSTQVFKVKIFAERLQNPVKVKEHSDAGQEHKKWYYAQTDENYLMALYENGKHRDFQLIDMFDLAALSGFGHGWYPVSKEDTIRGKKIVIPLLTRNGKDVVLKKGTKVLLYEHSAEEIYGDPSVDNLYDRLYKVKGLSSSPTAGKNKIYEYGTITLIHHREARPVSQLTEQSGVYQNGDGKTLRKLKHTQFNALVEGVDFVMNRLGEINIIILSDE